MSKQREALELALDALISDNPDIMLRASVAIREALAETEQEPVAWYLPEGIYDSQFRDHQTVISCKGNNWEGWKPLYTTPPADRLIAAAPDLLEALEALIEDQRDASLPVLAQARAAIAKAKGEA